MFKHEIIAKGWRIFIERITCPLTTFMMLRFLMFRAFNSWVHSLLQKATSIF